MLALTGVSTACLLVVCFTCAVCASAFRGGLCLCVLWSVSFAWLTVVVIVVVSSRCVGPAGYYALFRVAVLVVCV